jgi:predicted ATPase
LREKELLQTLAVMGREFTIGLIRRVADGSEIELDRSLAALQAGEFIHEQPAFPEVEYIFKHALTQEVAYNSVLIERRKLLHERTAEGLQTLFADSIEEHLAELAYH